MQLTTKTEYSVRALVTLSESRDDLRSINEICTKQNLPNKYVEQLFRKLKKHSVIGSLPGSKGGYFLKLPASEITLSFIMEVVENHPYEVSCERNSVELEYCQVDNCQYKHLWHEIYGNVKAYLSTITLKDIKNRIDKE
ncbi:Rrf2 family transcriptional regulator [bacterium]|nr:Rrf2 family transcriptional regulator [bacterium]